MKKIYSFIIALFIGGFAFGQATTTYTAVGPGTWVCPAGVASLTVDCWGAGGGGGNSGNTNSKGGSGGGGGAYCKSVLTVTPGNTYYIFVGTGGAGAPTGIGNASAGGFSWFNSANITPGSNAGVLAGGGGLGGNNGGTIGAAGAATYWTSTGTSGVAGSIGVNNGGGDGGAGASGGAGGLGSSSGNGSSGTVPGGGGGGSDDDATASGGSGANGRVVLTWCPVVSLTSTSASSPISTGSTSTVTLTGAAANLPIGTYTVTYNLSAPNAATGLTATLTVSSAGTGTFTTSALANAGITTVTITGIKMGTCSNTAISSNNTASITVNAPLVYCTNTNTTNTTYFISSFSTTGGSTNITNNSSGFSANGYGNFTAMSCSGALGSTINFSITETGGTMHFGIWIDWNQDGDFSDSGEDVYVNNSTYQTTVTGSFSIPAGASLGSTRMRVVGNESGTVAACTGTGYTECEDYTITLSAPLAPSISGLGAASGCIGSSLTINGANFSGATSVTIGGTAATITANTGSAITVTVGAGTTGTVAVTTLGGTATSAATFTVISLPVVSVSPTSASYCPSATPISLTASGATTYAWTPSAGLSATTGSSVTASPASTTTYTVTGTASTCTASATTTITVIVPPVFTSVTATPTNVCTGANSQLLASCGGSTVADYLFSASSGAFTPISGGTAVATSTSAADFLADDETSVSIPIGFTFNYLGVGYSSLIAMSNGYVSFNGSATSAASNNLATSSATQRPLLAPLWDDLDGASGSGAANYITTGSAGSRVFTIEWLNWQWYYSATGSTISFQIKLYEATGEIEFIYRQESGTISSPSASIGITGVATGSGNYLSLNGTGASPAASSTSETTSLNTKPATGQVYKFSPYQPAYSWSPATFLSATNIANPIATGVTATTTYTVTASAGGCTTTASVSVNVAPLTCGALTTGGGSACAGLQNVTAHPSGGGSVYTYAWKEDASVMAGTTATVMTTAGTHTYTCTVTDNCGSTCSSSLVVVTNPSPTITSQPAAATILAGTTATFSVTYIGTPGYQWQYATAASGPWANVANGTPANVTYAGATTPTLSVIAASTATAGSANYYQCVATSGGCSTPSNSAQLTIANYCTSSATSTSDMDITKVTFGTIANTSPVVSLNGGQGNATGTAGMYSNWRASTVPVPSIQQGAVQSFEVIIGGTAYSHRVDVYFDFNHDGDLSDADESFPIFAYANPALPKTTTANITIPVSALTGNTIMRVVCVEASSSSSCGTYTWGETEDYLVNITAAPACGIPVGGTTVASASPVCPGVPVTLTVTGSTIASGLTFQWESSPTGGAGTWTPISGATNTTLVVNPTVSTYYHRNIICAATPSTAPSSSLQVVVNFTFACYCTSTATSTSDMDIGTVAFGTINNTTACGLLNGTQGNATGTASMYSNFTGSGVPVPNVQQGSTYPISVTIPTCGSAYSHRIDVYIDLNRNGLLTDAGESFAIFAYASPGLHTATANISIPLSAVLGNTLMRVVVVESSTANPCGTYTWGETEDYTINITAAPACAGTPNAGTALASIASVCSGNTANLSLTGNSIASGLTYQWQSSPDNLTFTNISGANSMNYTATVTGNTWYKCIVTCTASGLSNASTVVNVSAVTCYTMDNTSVVTCAGKFYDSGGPLSDYGSSETFTKTFTPSSAGNKIRVTFNSFLTEASYDKLSVYDGPTTASPLIGTYSGTVSIGTITSTAANGELTFMFVSDGGSIKAGWDADIICYLPAPMAYVSSAVTQANTSYVTPGSPDQEIIGVNIVTLGALTPFALTSLNFNTTGSTAALTDILDAKLWYTGTSGTFAVSAQNLPTFINPNGAGTITLATPQVLQEGTNYFWLTYSIKSTAVLGHVVDAECTQIVMDGTGGTRIPAPTTVVGNRPISACVLGTGTIPVVLPFANAIQSTAGQVNDITSTNVSNVCGNSSYYTGEDVVYVFTPATAGSMTVALTSAGTYTGVVLYKGCPMNGQGGICVTSEQSSTGDKNFCVNVEANVTYYLIVDSYSTYASSNAYGISISAPDPLGVPNDLPCNATPVLIGDLTPGDNACANGTGEPAAPACWTNGTLNTVWYTLTTGAGQTSIKIKTIVGSLLNTQIAVYSGVCGAGLTYVACNDDVAACGSSSYYNSELTVAVAPLTTYYVVVDGKNSLKGTFSLVWVDGAAAWPAVPGQDCILDVPVCSETFTVGNPGYQAVGNSCDFGTSYCLASGERGSAWYEIKVNANGNLMFTIEPNDVVFNASGLVTDDGTDYDYAVWKKTGTGAVSCADILSGSSTPLSCNYSYIGVTGLYTNGNSPTSNSYTGHTYTSGSYDAAFEDPLPVVAGESYWLVISNYSNSTSGFTINFSNSSNGFNFSVPNPLIWTGGASSTNWFDARNWGNCVQIPDATHDCIIAASSMYQPIIDNVGAVCRSITINSGASLQISSFQNLDVYGSYNNQGTFNGSAISTVTMRGTAAQTMDGIMVTPYEFFNLFINKTGGSVTANQHIECNGNFATQTSVNSIMNMNNNNHTVGMNFTNYSGNTTYIPGTGTLIFDGSGAQTYTNSNGILTLNNVTMLHTGTGVTIANDMNLGASGVLTLTSGKIITNGFLVNVANSATTAVTTGNTTSYVEGNLRRSILPTGSYDFPVGYSTKGYQRANFDFTSATTINNLTARFDPWSGAPVALGLSECSVTYDMPSLDNGFWTVVANATPLSGRYTATLYNLNYTNSAGVTASTIMSDHTGALWQLLNGDGSNGNCVASPITAVVRTNMNGFSKFGTALTGTGTLPIELLSFRGRPVDEGNLLNWITVSELNNDYFLPEKSEDGVNFVEMTRVQGAGNSDRPLNYEFLDENPFSPVTYYKLKQVDFDGEFTYSDIISVRNANSENQSQLLSLYPNPATHSVNIEIYSPVDGFMDVEIVDLFGRVLSRDTYPVVKGTGIHTVDISTIATGVYFSKINFTTTSNEVYKRFIKQ